MTYTTITRGGRQSVAAEVIDEQALSICVNSRELVTVMCTPIQQEALALGFLANENIIHSMADVELLQTCNAGTCVDVWLAHSDFQPPRHNILTSGCAGGMTFDDFSAAHPPLEAGRHIASSQLWARMDDMHQAATLYSRSRGVHCSALSDGERLLLSAEDVGRHNTLDKLRGLALQQDIRTRDCIMLSTGRISSEMISKAWHMEVPIVCSRSSPTSLSVALAKDWNITLVGYLHQDSMNIYTHSERILLE
ncbi:MAG: formate dehydrogenase accessory sulfurtransferase FdhD [Anaerolineae bacterium]|nr:formate dehydrogenase accessory sulfurtransferase FdhD [Anaerolineae bacterium]